MKNRNPGKEKYYFLVPLFCLLLSCNTPVQKENTSIEEKENTAIVEKKNTPSIQLENKDIESQCFVSDNGQKIYFKNGKTFDILKNHPFKSIPFPKGDQMISSRFYNDTTKLDEEIRKQLIPDSEKDRFEFVPIHLVELLYMTSQVKNNGVAISYSLRSYSDVIGQIGPFTATTAIIILNNQGEIIKTINDIDRDVMNVSISDDLNFLGLKTLKHQANGEIIGEGYRVYDIVNNKTIYQKEGSEIFSGDWGQMGYAFFGFLFTPDKNKRVGKRILIDPYTRIEYSISFNNFSKLMDAGRPDNPHANLRFKGLTDKGWKYQNAETGIVFFINPKIDYISTKF